MIVCSECKENSMVSVVHRSVSGNTRLSYFDKDGKYSASDVLNDEKEEVEEYECSIGHFFKLKKHIRRFVISSYDHRTFFEVHDGCNGCHLECYSLVDHCKHYRCRKEGVNYDHCIFFDMELAYKGLNHVNHPRCANNGITIKEVLI